jgi:type II secretory pathway pseudopilin PulG
MTNDELMTNFTGRDCLGIRHCGIPSSFGIRASSFRIVDAFAFTITELLIVIAIIIVLAGLILSTVGYVQKKGARSRAETEIAAMSAALESYKADNGIYPTDSTKTEQVDPAVSPTPAAASLYLYEQLSGDTNDDRAAEGESYFTFKPGMLLPAPPSTNPVTAMRDPFGNPYGYSTARAAGQAYGYNPTFDLWSTGGDNTGDQRLWIKNW